MKRTSLSLTATLIGIMAMTACKRNANETSGRNTDTINYSLNAGSVIEWKGIMRQGYNSGSFDIDNSNIETKNGIVTSGTITIPISSIKNYNLPDSALKEQLLHHLKSADFFNLAVYPTATFRIRQVQPYPGGDSINPTAKANCLVDGSFTMLGKTNPVTFPAYIHFSGEQMEIAAFFTIDRTKWGMTYASDSSAGLFIYKDVALRMAVNARRK